MAPKEKKEKDPSEPKRPANAYVLWSNDNRQRLVSFSDF
jgi:hypothetical protein